MPRIREYAGYGNSNADSDGESQQRERVYRLPEVTAEEAQEKSDDSESKPAEKTEQVKPAPSKATDSATQEFVIAESDVAAKYTDAQVAIDSIVNDGVFYEDYMRAGKTELMQNKEFVLTAVAQSYDRFYAPQTPKTTEWIDELYLTERAAFFFEQTRESTKEDETAAFATELHCYLRKLAFSATAYQTIDGVLKRVAKVASARVNSAEDAERMRASLERFQSAVNAALIAVKEKHSAMLASNAARKDKLTEEKKQLVGIVDGLKFEF